MSRAALPLRLALRLASPRVASVRSLAVVVGAGAAAGCGSSGEDPSVGTLGDVPPDDGGMTDATAEPYCVDKDGDGYGTGNACLGTDCNDNDPNITQQCLGCAHPGIEGCPCGDAVDGGDDGGGSDGGALEVDCGTVVIKVGTAEVCGPGVSYCSLGKWTGCQLKH